MITSIPVMRTNGPRSQSELTGQLDLCLFQQGARAQAFRCDPQWDFLQHFKPLFSVSDRESKQTVSIAAY